MLLDPSILTFAADVAATEPAEIIPALFSWPSLIALITLATLEIVLGIDNVIFIAILTGKLPPEKRVYAQRLGIGLAVGMRILLLLMIFWLVKLTAPLISIDSLDVHISGKDLIMLLGGLFLIGKATWELHHKLEAVDHTDPSNPSVAKAVGASLALVIVQILLVDIVFSLDSVITAVGMSKQVEVMIAAVVIASGVMMFFAKAVSDFVEKHPTMKVLALAFLILIGTMLVADGFHQHIPKGYIYFAMAFSLGVEMFNMKLKARSESIRLRNNSLPNNPSKV